MSEHRPLSYRWTGSAMEPLLPEIAEKQFTAGETYRLELREERSVNSHRHYFSAIKEAWDNLPEHHAERFPTPEHLRKYALIRAGYRTERAIVASSKAEAQRIASFIRPMDEFAVVQVHEATVSVYEAKSQSVRAMGARAFQQSKQDVLDTLAGLIDVGRKTLEENAGQAA